MRSKNFILITLIVAIMCVVIWWFMRPTTSPVKTTEVSTSAKVETPKYVASQPITTPIPPPMPNPIAAQPLPASPPDSHAAAIVELNDTFTNIVNLLRDNNMLGAYLAKTQPDKIDPNFVQEIQEQQQKNDALLAQDPSFRQSLLQGGSGPSIKFFETLETQTPTFNATGDEATYLYSDNGIGPRVYADNVVQPVSITFVRINGNWYLKSAN
jgi:hypothetical protein